MAPVYIFTLVFSTLVVHAAGDLIMTAVGSDVKLFNGACATGKNWDVFHVFRGVPRRRVVSLWDGEVIPGTPYVARLNRSDPLLLTRVRMNDIGFYELVCGGDTTRAELQILPAVDVFSTIHQPAQLPCFFVTAGDYKRSVSWEKSGGLNVLVADKASRESGHGARFSGSSVSLRETWMEEGDMTLTVDAVAETHRGDYFCVVTVDNVRTLAAVVRLSVSPGFEATTDPFVRDTDCVWGKWVAAILVFVLLVTGLFCLKKKCSRDLKPAATTTSSNIQNGSFHRLPPPEEGEGLSSSGPGNSDRTAVKEHGSL